jgi:hypothetical protein
MLSTDGLGMKHELSLIQQHWDYVSSEPLWVVFGPAPNHM